MKRDLYYKTFVLFFISVRAFSQQTYTFTNCGAAGRFGPTQTQVTTTYSNTNLSGAVTSASGIQTWTVPQTGNYRITALGAQGGTSTLSVGTGGFGSRMRGDFFLTGGSILKLLVGQQGETVGYNAGGGGGTFVWINGQSLPLMAAGGGGGAGYSSSGINSSTATAGTLGASNITGIAGTNGNGANPGGGGWFSAGTNFQSPTTGCNLKCSGNTAGLTVGGASPTTTILYHGCAATSETGDGGFGGGSGGNGLCTTSYGGGGGGGYSGGVGQAGNSTGGGGGGSYNAGINQLNLAGNNSGDGKIIIQELCSINITVTGLSMGNYICSGNSVTLTTNAVGNYSWSTGATTPSIVVFPTSNSVYSFTGTSIAACDTSTSININVNNSIPSLTVVNSATNAGGVCPSSTATLTASGALTYTWVGATTVTNGVSFSPSTTSSYTVSGQNACGTSTAVTSISIHPIPSIGAVAATGSICSGNTTTVNLTGSSITSHTWSSIISGPSIANGVSFVPLVTNTYVVIGSSAKGCTATANTSVQVIQTPTLAPIASSLSLCSGNSASLTALGASGYTWTSGTSTVATTSSFVVSPNTTTTYSITKNNSTCFNTQSISILVYSLTPVLATANQTYICANRNTTLTAYGGISFDWFTPGSSIPNPNSNPVMSPSVTTTYTVAANNGTCINTAMITVSVHPNPPINIAATSTAICLGETLTLTATGANNYTWVSTVTGTTPGQASIIASPTTATMFHVIGDNNFNCTSTVSAVVLIKASPNISTALSKTLSCPGNSIILNASGGGLCTYQWDANANSASTASTIVNPNITTVYTVSVTLLATGCTASKTVQANIYSPILSVTQPTSTCFGVPFTLTASVINPSSASIMNYTWFIPGQVNSNGTSAVVSPSALTVYVVSANSTSNSVLCPVTKSTSVGIFHNPTITATPQRTFICRNEPLALIGKGGVNYNWNNNSFIGDTMLVILPSVGTFSYEVLGTDANGCSSTATLAIKVQGCLGIEEVVGGLNSLISIYPNPNNGEFNILSEKDMDIKLMNELGQVIGSYKLYAFNNWKIKVSDLAKGIYFIVGQNNSAITKQKIIVK